MFGLSDTGWVVLGGMATAFIGGAFTFGGIVVSALAQRKPAKVEPDPDAAEQAEVELAAMTLDRDRWRAVAETFMPHRRDGDPPVKMDDQQAELEE